MGRGWGGSFSRLQHKLLMLLLRKTANKDKKWGEKEDKEKAREGGNESPPSSNILRISLAEKPGMKLF